MIELNNIKGFWSDTSEQNSNATGAWEGQILLQPDGWFEGIVNNHNDNDKSDNLIFGFYSPQTKIELLKISEEAESDNFYIFHGTKEEEGLVGEYSLIDLFKERQIGVCFIITNVSEKQEDASFLQERIDSYKLTMNVESKAFYEIATGIRNNILEKTNNKDPNPKSI